MDFCKLTTVSFHNFAPIKHLCVILMALGLADAMWMLLVVLA